MIINGDKNNLHERRFKKATHGWLIGISLIGCKSHKN